jgi:cell wall-associated NlpC family hydrolase
MSFVPTAVLRLASRPLALLAAVAACAAPVGAQGPAQPADHKLAVVETPMTDGGELLASNLARLTAAGAPRPFVVGQARPFAAWSLSAHAFRDSILVSMARTAVGTRYVRGGESFEGGFDCSGLVRYIMTALDVAIPRTAAQQAGAGLSLERDATRLRPGDLLTFGKPSHGVSHIGIYVGNGRFVHASSAAGRVIESPIERTASPLVRAWRGARRVLSDAAADSTIRGDG